MAFEPMNNSEGVNNIKNVPEPEFPPATFPTKLSSFLL